MSKMRSFSQIQEARGELFSLNVTIGTATFIGSNGILGIDGLAWEPSKIDTIPESATIALLGIDFTVLAGGAARKKWKKKAVSNS